MARIENVGNGVGFYWCFLVSEKQSRARNIEKLVRSLHFITSLDQYGTGMSQLVSNKLQAVLVHYTTDLHQQEKILLERK